MNKLTVTSLKANMPTVNNEWAQANVEPWVQMAALENFPVKEVNLWTPRAWKDFYNSLICRQSRS